MTSIGTHVRHESAREHVTGSALYTEDLAGRFPGLLHAWPVVSPHAHARVTSIDAAAAHDVAGVAAILDANDVPGEGDAGANRHDEPLFPLEVLFHGQPVAWVLGESREAARAGAAAVRVQYEPLPAILTIDDAIAADSYLNDPIRLARGDMSALEHGSLRFSGELRIGGQEHFYLETQASIAWRDETGGCSVLSSTQHPSETQEIVARALALPASRVTVECLRMGGAFGGKEVQANPWAAVAAIGAWKTERPVMVRLTRALDMMLTGKRHPYLARYDAGFSAEGRICALRLQFYSDGGWSLDLSEPVMWRTLFHCENAYYVPAIEATGRVCRTHKTSQTAFRGFGGPQGMLVIEEVMAQAAQRLNLPPELVRERNLYQANQLTPYAQRVDEAERLSLIWRQLLENSCYAARRTAVDVFNAGHPNTKRGLAITPVKFGISFTATFFNQAGALVLVYRDGSVQVNHGGTEMGQGLLTKTARIAAGVLGLPLSSVRVMPARTDKVPNTSATAASSGTDLNGAAVADACRQILERIRPVAAAMFDCPSSTISFSEGMVAGGGRAARFAEVCERAYRERVPLFAQGYYRTPDIHFDAASGTGKPFHYFAYGAAVSEVEIDRFTGAHRLLRVDILEDVGDSIAPIVDRGQVEGGFIQGLGWLTIEELLWDGNGRLVTGGASTYKLPSWSEVPEVFNVAFLERATEQSVVFGSKAVGEPPLMLAISAREAIRDAVRAFNQEAVVTFDSPATPERIFFAIRRTRETRSAPALRAAAATATAS
jgi:xanthine dehydrogenase large subunit